MAPIWSYQPLKSVLTLLLITLSPVYFSFLSVYYIPKRLRPHPEWSLHTSLGRAFYYLLFKYAAAVRMAPDYAIKSGALKDRFVMANSVKRPLHGCSPVSNDQASTVWRHMVPERTDHG
jgi:hypothetical protein